MTGCSRWGKGAFVAGVLDNRIALTIPVESGIGGTVGMRLKEQLDPGNNQTDEWTWHAISYVRWLSEVVLKDFCNGDKNKDWSSSPELEDNDRLPVDMHGAMALIAPRGLYICDNSNDTYGLDPRSAWVTANIGKKIFEALGVGDNISCVGSSGTHCDFRSQYNASLNAMIDKFLLGKISTKTGTFSTLLGSSYKAENYYDWAATELPGNL